MGWDDRLGVAVMLVGGVLQLLAHPRKSYDLVVRGKGWHDDELDRRQERGEIL